MSKYRFAGTIKEIKSTTSSKELAFVPDRESVVSEKRGEDEILFVAFLPEDDKEEGIVFKYADNVRVISKAKTTGRGKVEWTPTWKVGGHYKLEFENVTVEKDCDVVFNDALTSKYFKLESVTEKA